MKCFSIINTSLYMFNGESTVFFYFLLSIGYVFLFFHHCCFMINRREE